MSTVTISVLSIPFEVVEPNAPNLNVNWQEVTLEVSITFEVSITVLLPVTVNPYPDTYCGLAGATPFPFEYPKVPDAVNKVIELLNDSEAISVSVNTFVVATFVVATSNK